MKPARPYWINHPPTLANGSIPESQRFYEVVGHRDGPVVARFYFYDEPDQQREALADARELCARRNGEEK